MGNDFTTTEAAGASNPDIAPLFVESLAALKSRLRLSGAASADALAILNDVIETVRVGFYEHLGATRIAQLLSYAYTTNATTPELLLRTKANNCEVAWVRMLLIRRLPSMFVDGNSARQTWNEDGLTRDLASYEIQKEISRLEEEVNQALSDLSAGENSEGTIQGGVMEPDEAPPRIGESINPASSWPEL